MLTLHVFTLEILDQDSAFDELGKLEQQKGVIFPSTTFFIPHPSPACPRRSPPFILCPSTLLRCLRCHANHMSACPVFIQTLARSDKHKPNYSLVLGQQLLFSRTVGHATGVPHRPQFRPIRARTSKRCGHINRPKTALDVVPGQNNTQHATQPQAPISTCQIPAHYFND